MAVAAEDGHPRLGKACFGADHVDDTVLGMEQAEIIDTELMSVAFQRFYLEASHGVGHRLILMQGGDIVVRDAGHLLRAERTEATVAQSLESLGAGHFVAVEAVYIELKRPVRERIDDVSGKYLVKECLRHKIEIMNEGAKIRKTTLIREALTQARQMRESLTGAEGYHSHHLVEGAANA
jgi:hypothetical protein